MDKDERKHDGGGGDREKTWKDVGNRILRHVSEEREKPLSHFQCVL